MWILTPFGFFSVVQKPEDKAAGTLTIRARVKADLDALREKYLPDMGVIVTGAGTDYKYRAKVPRDALAKAAQQMVLDLDYSNFKNEVGKRQGAKRANVYHKVWDVLYTLQDAEDETAQEPAEAKPASGVIYGREPKPNTSYGGVLFDRQGQVLLRKPRGEYDGYVWTFAKGRAQAGQTTEQTAFREVLEETGLKAMIVCPVPGSFQGGTGKNEYFVMRPFGEPQEFDAKETEEIRWVSLAEARELIRLTRNHKGRTRDIDVLDAATAAYQKAMPVWEQTAIAEAFGRELGWCGIYLPLDILKNRQRGRIVSSRCAVWYLFGADEQGEFLDYYSSHRATGDSHARLYANGRIEYLPSIQGGWCSSPDPEDAARQKAKFFAENQRIAKMLEEKGFGLVGDEPGGVQINRYLYLNDVDKEETT